MAKHSEIGEFLEDWKEVRGKTVEFIEKLPEDKMTWSPHGLLGTFGMQIRHLIKSQEAYIKGIKSGKVDFSNRSFNPEIEKNKKKALYQLKKLDREFVKYLNSVRDPEKEVIFVDGVYGEHKVKLTKVLSYLLGHELYHQGILTCYGRLVGLGKFRFM